MTPPNADKDAEKADHSHSADGNVKWYRAKQLGSYL